MAHDGVSCSLLYDLSVHLSFYLFSLLGFCFYLLSYIHHLMVVLSCCVNPCSVVVAALCMVSCKSFIVCFSSEMVAVCLLFCSIIPENMVIIILMMVDNESTSTDKSAGALSFSSLQSFSASCFNSLKSIESP